MTKAKIEYNDISKDIWHLDPCVPSAGSYVSISNYATGKIRSKTWYLHGRAHREAGPAHIKYYYNGRIELEEWYVHGKEHRVDGPAYISYEEDGRIFCQDWLIRGVEVVPFESNRPHLFVADLIRKIRRIPKDVRKFLNKHGMSNTEIAKLSRSALCVDGLI